MPSALRAAGSTAGEMRRKPGKTLRRADPVCGQRAWQKSLAVASAPACDATQIQVERTGQPVGR